ncbi:MAG TPA: immune inhibitor A domain-containing protein [Gaiellaceae bacterium]|nr:immune inhibitor A domain-containing protein [Gaiellaceae bacterium]
MKRFALAAAAATSLSLVLVAGAFAGAPFRTVKSDNLSSPLQDQQQALMQKGAALKASGAVDPNQTIAQVGRGHRARYVQLKQTGHGNIFVILAQFGAGAGPAANEIQKPDRSLDNSTIWFDGGYTPQHYQQLYFDHSQTANSVTNYYQLESSGRFDFDGSVTDWTTVPHDEAFYGSNTECGGDCAVTSQGGGLWQLLKDAANQWVLDQEAAGKSLDDIKAYLAQFDQEDRYDYNGNGNFDEPDGYIDHFQLIHAGEGEEIGGGAQGDDAIWSHRWYAWQNGQSGDGSGPAGKGQFGGFEIGQDVGQPTGFWVGDYVMEPENAGVGVIAHETGHDYGLPDEYDQTYTGTAPSTWWTIMSQGSYGGDGTNGIGNRPVDFDGYDKLLLGFLNYKVVDPFADNAPRRGTDVTLGPSEYNTKDYQAAIVPLPQKEVQSSVGAPTEGGHAGYSATGDNFDSTAVHTLSVPASAATLSFDAWYDMEQDWDYAYLEVSTDNGSTWTDIATSQSDPADNDQSGFNSDGTGITGTSGAGRLDDWYGARPAPAWTNVSADLSAYAGQTVQIRFEYVSDSGTHGLGFEFDNLKFGSAAVDGVEDASAWTFDGGFHQTTGTDTNFYDDYYVVENREYLGYDTGLKTSPYIFGDPSRPNWVEHFPFEDGVLVSYWNTQYTDNQTGVHPGEGLILPIDVHQNVILRDDGSHANNSVQASDATLSTDRTDSYTLPDGATGKRYRVDSQRGVTTFDDRGTYWNPAMPDEGVKTPGFGVVVDLDRIDHQGVARIRIGAAKAAPPRPPRHHDHDGDHGRRGHHH